MGAFNGSGTFVRSYSWVTDKTNGVPITASRVDTEDTGFASGLSLCLTRDGQGAMAANFIAQTGSAYDLGSVAVPWRNLNISGNANIAGNALLNGQPVKVMAYGTGAATLSAAAILAGQTYIVWRNALRAITSNTTQTIDPVLQLTAIPAGTYVFDVFVPVTWAAVGVGMTYGFNAPSGTLTSSNFDGAMNCSASYTAGGAAPFANTLNSFPNSSSNNGIFRGSGVFVVSATATVGPYFSQQNSSANALNIGIGSYVSMTRLA